MFEDSDLIHGYSRRDAIEDGVLVDVSAGELGELCREAGFRYPVAMTCEAFARTVGGIDDPLPAGQSITGRLWDVLMVLRFSIGRARESDRVHFKVSVWNGEKPEEVALWSLCGSNRHWPVTSAGTACSRICASSTAPCWFG